MIWEIYTKWNALFFGNFSAAEQDKLQVHNKVKDKEWPWLDLNSWLIGQNLNIR